MSHEFERVLDVLVDRDVLVEDDGTLRITDRFAERRDVDELPTDADALRDLTDGSLDDAEASNLARVADLSPRAVGAYLAVAEFCEDELTPGNRSFVTMTLDYLPPDPVRGEGSPELFTPIDAHHVPFVERFFRKAIVYIWREECEPCDAVRNDFDHLLDEAPADTALFSTYGPDAGGLLSAEFDVAGGPTTLFLLDGRVDLRLVGAQYPTVLETELETFEDM